MANIHLEDIIESINIHAKTRTSNILEGGFRSLYHGKSMDFDDLREYAYGDDVSDIDWKASSRSGLTLVRRNTAEKRHFMLVICDSGIKMSGETPNQIDKNNLCTLMLGVIARICKKDEIDVALLSTNNNLIELTPFKSSEEHIEDLMNIYENLALSSNNNNIDYLLRHSLDNIQKRLLTVVISDYDGLDHIDSKLLSELEEKNDIFFICIEDANLTDNNTFDLDSNNYFQNEYLSSKYLKEIEAAARQDKKDEIIKKVQTNNARIIFVKDEDDFYNQLDYLFAKEEE